MQNVVREILIEIVNRYDKTVWSEDRRLKGMLFDFCPANKKENNLLLHALIVCVPNKLLSGSFGPYEIARNRCADLICEAYGTSQDIAVWAVDSWAVALRIIEGELFAEFLPKEQLKSRGLNPADNYKPDFMPSGDSLNVSVQTNGYEMSRNIGVLRHVAAGTYQRDYNSIKPLPYPSLKWRSMLAPVPSFHH